MFFAIIVERSFMPETLNNNAEHEKNNAEPTEWDSMKKIKFDPEKASRLKLASAGNSFGEGRDDRNASVAPPEGEFSRTSSIMFGKTDKGENLDNGIYVSAEDIKTQIDAEVANSSGGQLVDTSYEPPKPVSVDEAMSNIIDEVKKDNDGINLSEKQINNASGKKLEITDSNNEVKTNSVLIFNKEVEISDGEYLSEKSVKEALEKYMIGTEAPAKSVAKKPFTEKTLKLSKKIAALTLGALLLLSIPGNEKVDATNAVPDISPTFGVEQVINNVAEEAVNQAIQENQSDGIQIGDKYSIPDAVAHESSDYQYGGKNNTTNLDEGEYDIQGFSVQNPVTHEIVDSNWDEDTDLNEFIEKNAEEMSTETGQDITPEDLQSGTKIHVGRNDNADQQQIGWVDYNDITNNGIEGGNNG